MTNAKHARNILRSAKGFLGILALVCSIVSIAVVIWVSRPLPVGLFTPEQTQSLTIEDRSGALLRTTRAGDGSLASWVTLQQVDPDLPLAFVAVEDRRFYRHHVVDPRSIGRALNDNLRRRRVVSGSSTITMQLARLVHPVGRSWSDKVVQAF